MATDRIEINGVEFIGGENPVARNLNGFSVMVLITYYIDIPGTDSGDGSPEQTSENVWFELHPLNGPYPPEACEKPLKGKDMWVTVIERFDHIQIPQKDWPVDLN